MQVLTIMFLFLSTSAQADTIDRINACEAKGGGSCIYELLRELASARPGHGDHERRGICATESSGNVFFQIDAPANASVACFFNGTAFNSPATYNSSAGRWSCSAWGKGNTQYQINLRVNQQDNFTDEANALANPCN